MSTRAVERSFNNTGANVSLIFQLIFCVIITILIRTQAYNTRCFQHNTIQNEEAKAKNCGIQSPQHHTLQTKWDEAKEEENKYILVRFGWQWSPRWKTFIDKDGDKCWNRPCEWDRMIFECETVAHHGTTERTMMKEWTK